LNSATLQGVPQKAKELLPDGYSIDYQGESREFVQEGNTLIVTFVFALIMLAAQFETFRDPFIILIALPTSMFGALLPLNILGVAGAASMNIYSQIGLVTLIGLISKHGILMVEFSNRLQVQEGSGRREAIERAASVRLRPILMTTAAMVVGMVPLIVAEGAGAKSRFAIGIVIAAGMSIGTISTLFVTPAIYTLIARNHGGKRGEAAFVLKGDDKPARRAAECGWEVVPFACSSGEGQESASVLPSRNPQSRGDGTWLKFSMAAIRRERTSLWCFF